MNTKKKTKVIKAWAVWSLAKDDFVGVLPYGDRIEPFYKEMINTEEAGMAIFSKRKWAILYAGYNKKNYKVVPCQIILTTPKGNK